MLLLSYYVVNLILLWKLKILYTTPTAAEVTALQLNYHFCALEINFCRFLIQSVCLNFEMNKLLLFKLDLLPAIHLLRMRALLGGAGLLQQAELVNKHGAGHVFLRLWQL